MRSTTVLGRLRRRVRRRWKQRPGLVPWLFAQPQKLLIALLGLLPLPWMFALADRLGRLAWWSPRRRALGRAHVQQAFPLLDPKQRDLLVRRSCGHLGRSAAEAAVFMPRMERRRFLDFIDFEEGARERLERHLGRGVLLLQCHLGSIECTTAILSVLNLRPMTPMRLPRNYYLARHLLASRNRGGVQAIPRQGAVKLMLKGLKDGSAVVLTFDQNAHHAPLFVPWFGKPAATERTPAALAWRTGSPVLLCWCVRRPGPRPFLFGCRLLREAQAPGAAGDAELAQLTAEFHGAMEQLIRSHPEQYLWIHDRYRTRPPEPS